MCHALRLVLCISHEQLHLISLLPMCECVKLHGAEGRIHSYGGPLIAVRCSLFAVTLPPPSASPSSPPEQPAVHFLFSVMSRLHTLGIATLLLLLLSATLTLASPSHHYRHRQRDAARREAAAAAAAAAPASSSSAPSARLEVPPFTAAIDPRILKTPIHAADVPLQTTTAAVESKAKSSSQPADPSAQPCSHADKPRDISSDKQSIKQKAKNALNALMQRIKDIRARIEHRETKGEGGEKGTAVS